MAQLPGERAIPTQRTDEPSVKMSHEPDPSQVSTMLSSFYGGVRRAAAEDEDDRSGPAGQADR
jgi:hypothetical protein